MSEKIMRLSKLLAFIVALGTFLASFGFGYSAHAFTRAVAVTADEDDGTLFVLDGSGSVWGYLRPDELLEPVKLLNLTHIKQIVPFAALTQDGHVFTWDYGGPACPLESPPANDDEYGGGRRARELTYSLPREVPGLSGIVSIAGDERHFLALRRDGRVLEFGEKLSTEILAKGRPEMNDWCSALSSADLLPTPMVVTSISNAIAVAADDDTNGALEKNGFFFAWGGGGIYTVDSLHERAEDWRQIKHIEIFVGSDKSSISISNYVIAISLNKKPYYWGLCEAGGYTGNYSNIVTGTTDHTSGVSKITSSHDNAERQAYVLSNGKVLLQVPGVSNSLDSKCNIGLLSSNAQPVFVSQMNVKAIDATLQFRAGAVWLLTVGTNGSLWTTKILNDGSLADLINVDLP